MKQKIKVAIVDDDPIYRQILTTYLGQFQNLHIFPFSNGKECIEGVSKQKLDIVLMDLEMSMMSGIETTEHLSKHHPEIKILIHTMHNEDGLSHDLIAKGAHGFLLKDKGFEEVAVAIQVMNKHGYYFGGWNLQKIITAKKGNKTEIVSTEIDFTKRELQIMELLCKEKTNKEVSAKLHISTRTVEWHRRNILKKANVKSTDDLKVYAEQKNLFNNKHGEN